MHKITFFPIGNADSYLIDLECGRKLLFDYANVHDPKNEDDKRIDLEAELRKNLDEADRNYLDAVAFTHLDKDHYHRSTEFFYLEHAKKYQDEHRIKIKELWVPAAVILEEALTGEAAVLRAEARYRLKNGSGIRVFSRPARLQSWLEGEGISIEDRRHLITDAGQIIPGYGLADDGIEFFVHSPFAITQEDGTSINRNEASLVLQATFNCEGELTYFLLTADTTHEIWKEIVNITKYHNNEERLKWHISKIPHHCSYLSLSSEKGMDVTKPIPEVQWLLDHGQDSGLLISPSKPIPQNDDDDQPPHRQAANCYRAVAAGNEGEFKVTMEHPSISRPEPLVIAIDSNGHTLIKKTVSAASIITSRITPRAG